MLSFGKLMGALRVASERSFTFPNPELLPVPDIEWEILASESIFSVEG